MPNTFLALIYRAKVIKNTSYILLKRDDKNIETANLISLGYHVHTSSTAF